MTVRWPMMMGFAVLGLFLVKDLFPDMSVIADAASLLKTYSPEATEAGWGALLSSVAQAPAQYPKELVEGLQSLLGADWAKKLLLVSYHGTVNPERILPAVLFHDVAQGLRGLFLVALIAASMSTFDSTVNATTGRITRDIYQKYIRPRASTRELIYASWAFVCLLVGVSFLFAYSIKSINDIWGWIIMGLGGGLMLPSFLRLYWWRFNGSGFAVGTFVGLTAAVLQRLYFPALDERIQFLVIGAIGFAGALAGTYLAAPTDALVLKRFYRSTRPFGVWGPLHAFLSDDERLRMKKEHWHDITATPFALAWQDSMFMLPMQLLIGAWKATLATGTLWCIGLVGLYLLWYRHLPEQNFFEPDKTS